MMSQRTVPNMCSCMLSRCACRLVPRSAQMYLRRRRCVISGGCHHDEPTPDPVHCTLPASPWCRRLAATAAAATPPTRYTYTHTRLTVFSGTTQVSRYEKGKINLDFTEARDSKWQWHQLGHMQVCTLFQTDNHTSTPPLLFFQVGCPSCRPTNSVKALT